MDDGRTARQLERMDGVIISAGKTFTAWAPAAIPAKASEGVAAPGLAARYTQALEALGHSCFTIDAQDATVAGAGLIENCLPRVE